MVHRCDKCNGEGRILRFKRDLHGKKVLDHEETCKHCKGNGICSVCGGSGAIYGHAFSVSDSMKASAIVVVEASCPGRKGHR